MSADFEKDKTWIGELSFFSFVVFRHPPAMVKLDRTLTELGRKYAKSELTATGAPDYGRKVRFLFTLMNRLLDCNEYWFRAFASFINYGNLSLTYIL